MQVPSYHSVVVDHNPGVDIEDDHGHDGEYCEAVVNIPVYNKTVEWSPPLLGGSIKTQVLLHHFIRDYEIFANLRLELYD